MADFKTDLDELEVGVNQAVQPAVEHFRGELEAVEVIQDHTAGLTGGLPQLVAIYALYQAASTGVLERQRAVVRSLEDFREALKDVIRTYRTVEETNAESFRGES
ncbi:MAG TPA: hypothetical protein VF821_00160 [Lentzea sp.]